MDPVWVNFISQSPAAAAVIFVVMKFLAFLREERASREKLAADHAAALERVNTETHTVIRENTAAFTRVESLLAAKE